MVNVVTNSRKGELWKSTRKEDMQSMRKNETRDKWVFKKNMNKIIKSHAYKAQLVAKGYSQVDGVNFGEIFSPIFKLASIRVLMSLVSKLTFRYNRWM